SVPKRRQTVHGFREAILDGHAWDGVYAFEEMPGLPDPDRDWVASANNPPWGGKGPYLSLGNWADGFR
ncbi:MAG: hypothetical protein GWN71_24860, partial [Gammaproteobacteria bacterium]|nr:hypothetical protein [Gemmatimonadota bacterium]NIU76675.1 hypothetical protein [Gammaproteobacteria bacterium]